MTKLHSWAVLAALLVLTSTRLAFASPLFELTGGFGGMGGLQARQTGGSAASAYFNPALLTEGETGLTAGLLVLNTNIGVRLDTRSPGNDVPPGLTDTFHPDRTPVLTKPIGTSLLENGRAAAPDGSSSYLAPRPRQGHGSGDQTITYAAMGLLVKLLNEKLAIGFYTLAPLKNFLVLNSFYVDEREQYMTNSLHPEMYGDRLTAVSVAFGAGVRLTDTLSLGVGATLAISADANAPVFVASASQLTNLDLNLDGKAKLALTPHMGIAWNPGKRWHLTGTLHAPQRFQIEPRFSFLLATAVEQSSGLAFTFYYQPWQASAGLGYDVLQRAGRTLTVSGQLQYQRWSQYVNRQSERPAGAYEWMDTLTGTVGLRLREGALSLGLDGQYKPTPVPDQTGRTNYVDNNRIGTALSMEYAFEIRKLRFKLGAQLQLFRLLERHVRKIAPPTADGVNRTPQLVWDEVPDDSVRGRQQPVPGREGLQTNNPGWPGYASLGWVSSGGVYLSLLL